MKKLALAMLVLFLTTLLLSCNNQSLEKNVEEVLDDSNVEQSAGTIYGDSDNIFQYISKEYTDYTIEDYNNWTVNYFDLNQDGNDEIIYTTTYYDGNLDTAIVITSNDGELKEIPSYIPLDKYENTFSFEDGFLVNTTKSGGSGAFYVEMSLYAYDGHKMIDVLEQSLLIEEMVAVQTADYHITSEISGTLKDFVIEKTKKDNQTDVEEMVAKDRYVYDEESGYFFWRTPLSISSTAKSFDQIYNGTNLKDSIEYFNENLYNFSEEGIRDFSIQVMKVIEQDRLKMFPMNDSPFHYIASDAYNIQTNELDLSNTDEYTKDVYTYMEKRGIYKLAKSFYADQGEVSENGYDVIIDYWMFEMLKPVLGFAYPDRYTPNDYTALEPFMAHNFQLHSVKQVENSMIVYPNILAASYDDVMKLEGANTWKAKVFLPVEVISN